MTADKTVGDMPYKFLHSVKGLADALRVTTDYLLGRTDDMEASASTADTPHRHYSGLSAEYQEMADDFIGMLASKAKGKKPKGG